MTTTTTAEATKVYFWLQLNLRLNLISARVCLHSASNYSLDCEQQQQQKELQYCKKLHRKFLNNYDLKDLASLLFSRHRSWSRWKPLSQMSLFVQPLYFAWKPWPWFISDSWNIGTLKFCEQQVLNRIGIADSLILLTTVAKLAKTSCNWVIQNSKISWFIENQKARKWSHSNQFCISSPGGFEVRPLDPESNGQSNAPKRQVLPHFTKNSLGTRKPSLSHNLGHLLCVQYYKAFWEEILIT